MPSDSQFDYVLRAFTQFEFDVAKDREVFGRHGFDLLYAAGVFLEPVLERLDDRFDYGELRYQVIGETMGR